MREQPPRELLHPGRRRLAVVLPVEDAAGWLTPARLAAENARHDRILAGLVVLLGFLLASFPVSNADAWLHLRSYARWLRKWGFDPGRHIVPRPHFLKAQVETDRLPRRAA